MRRRRVLAGLMLAVLVTVGSSWLGDLVLWAQEGALSQADELQKRQEKVAQAVAKPTTPAAAQPSPAAAPQVTYEEGVSPGQAAATGWSNMNWFALYLVLVVPTTYFVFRGAAH